MGEPKNHHYVSRCHIKNFFNKTEKKIYLFDKLENNFYFSESSKNIFSENYLNSRLDNGIIDNTTLERELQVKFEDHFNRITELIEDFDTNILKNNEETIKALYRLTLYGLIGDLRNPNHKKEKDDFLKSVLDKLIEISTDELSAQIQQQRNEYDKTKYINGLNYFEIATIHLEKMGELDFTIFIINSDDIFLLPDTSSICYKAKINEYFNPDIYEKAMVGIPLTSKIYIHAESKKLPNTSNRVIRINGNDNKIVAAINKDIYEQSFKTVAACDKSKLSAIINKIKGSV